MVLDVENTRVGNLLKFCPECGRELVPHPCAEGRMSCFGHGDFVIHGSLNGVVYDTPVIQWRSFNTDRLLR